MTNNRKLYDCFCYFNEDLVLELRLKTLWDWVDVFVICEARFTTSGLPKPINFNPKKFEKYITKIRHLIVDNPIGGTHNPWANERQQRNSIKEGLYDAAPDDFVIISDLDEIPNPTQLNQYDPKYKRGDFQQKFYSYFFNNELVEPTHERFWYGSKITTFDHFVTFFSCSAENVRSYKSQGLLRALKRKYFLYFEIQVIDNGGWHFTWLYNAKDIPTKIKATAHQEINQPEYLDPDHIKRCLTEGRDIVVPQRRYKLKPVDDSFPKPLRSEAELFHEFMLNPQ